MSKAKIIGRPKRTPSDSKRECQQDKREDVRHMNVGKVPWEMARHVSARTAVSKMKRHNDVGGAMVPPCRRESS